MQVKNFVFTVMISLGGVCFGTNPAHESFARANVLYEKQAYDSAAILYENLVSQGVTDAAVFYNLGNCYFKTNLIGKAILHYERALLRDPSDESIRFNLELARAKNTDKIDAIPGLFLTEWLRDFSAWANSNTWAVISVALFPTGLALLFLFFFARTLMAKKLGFYTGLFALLISGLSFYFAKKQHNTLFHNRYAIILSPSVTAKSSPASNGTSLFVIHEGLKVEITDKVGNWNEIKLPNGHTGWVETSTLERI